MEMSNSGSSDEIVTTATTASIKYKGLAASSAARLLRLGSVEISRKIKDSRVGMIG